MACHFLEHLSKHQRQGIATLKTPYYLISERALMGNLQIIERLCQMSGAKALLALKCFATWGVFDVMKPYLHGTTSSSLNEVKLGAKLFGSETHAYSVAYSEGEIDEVLGYADKIIFNSLGQLHRFGRIARQKGVMVGLRVNPKISNSSFLMADPARSFSRLGESDLDKIMAVSDQISGIMLHYNCENADFDAFSQSLEAIEHKFGELFYRLDWISLGGGIHFIGGGYPVESLAKRLKHFADKYGVQVYLEPGEAVVHNTAVLVTTVLDTLYNDKPLAVVDSSIEAHMLDLLIYQQSAPLAFVNDTAYGCADSADGTMIYGSSCLSGDVFGEYDLIHPLKVGDKVAFGNAAAYTIVKNNWFNGVHMPSIVIASKEGQIKVRRSFGYDEYKSSLS